MDWIASLGVASVWRGLSVLVLSWLALFFGRTLAPGQVPLIERIARVSDPELKPELARYTPKLAAALTDVEASGVDRMVALAAGVDERIFRSPAERLADWRHRWGGLVHWFRASPSEAERL